MPDVSSNEYDHTRCSDSSHPAGKVLQMRGQLDIYEFLVFRLRRRRFCRGESLS